MREEIESTIKNILVSELGVDRGVVAECTAATPLLGRGIGIDSIETLALVVGLEEKFSIEIADDDLKPSLFQSIASLTDYVIDCTSIENKKRVGE